MATEKKSAGLKELEDKLLPLELHLEYPSVDDMEGSCHSDYMRSVYDHELGDVRTDEYDYIVVYKPVAIHKVSRTNKVVAV